MPRCPCNRSSIALQSQGLNIKTIATCSHVQEQKFTFSKEILKKTAGYHWHIFSAFFNALPFSIRFSNFFNFKNFFQFFTKKILQLRWKRRFYEIISFDTPSTAISSPLTGLEQFNFFFKKTMYFFKKQSQICWKRRSSTAMFSVDGG